MKPGRESSRVVGVDPSREITFREPNRWSRNAMRRPSGEKTGEKALVMPGRIRPVSWSRSWRMNSALSRDGPPG